jgi:hypothetical protein
MRQLVAEIMRSKGHSEEEIKERNQFASTHVPGLPVDDEMPPAQVEPMRRHLLMLYEQCQQNPEAHAAWVAQKTAKMASMN